MVWMYHAGSAERSGGHTHMHAHTDMYTLIRTTGIRHWFVCVYHWNLELALDRTRWEEAKNLNNVAEEVTTRRLAHGSWMLLLPMV